jgi:hypothetical protein
MGKAARIGAKRNVYGIVGGKAGSEETARKIKT